MFMREKLEFLAQQTVDVVCNWRSFPKPAEGTKPSVVAHRGAWSGTGHTENTLPAFIKARELGVWAIEFDVRFTRDGVAVVHHDRELERCHGRPEVIEDLKFTELKKIAPMVPSLEDVLALQDLHFMIEVKTPLGEKETAILAQALARYKPVEGYHLLTLYPDFVRIHSALPEVAWMLVGDIRLTGLVDEAIRRELGGVAGHYLAMNESLISKLHARQMMAGSGFAPNLNLYQREWSRSVDWVFTNTPDKII